jgi:uncharacterized protein
MLKVVIDTNILVSALLKPDSTPELIISLVLEKQVVFCLSEPIAAEYEEVLSREKFKSLDRRKVKTLLTRLQARARWVKPDVYVDIIPNDREDNKFLECAQEAKADFLITGKTRHFPFKKFEKTRIVSPAEFLSVIAEKIPM